MKHSGLFRRTTPNPSTTDSQAARADDFSYLDPGSTYLDSACQSLRPQPVLDAMTEYYTAYNACGGRVKYAWGTRVDNEVQDARRAVLDLLGLSARQRAVSFTLNTTFGLNLLLQQLPQDRFASMVTSHIEHNSVFLPTMTAATRLGVPRLVLDRTPDGALVYQPAQLERAVVVVNVASNIDGRLLTNLTDLVRDTHARGGIVILDAAQAMAHSRALLAKTEADALCFSAHKMYGASLGVIVATHELIESLDLTFVGGGMVADVREDSYDLLPGDPGALLEPGLQAWGEIIALRRAIGWLGTVRPGGQTPAAHVAALSQQMFEGLAEIPGLTLLNTEPSPVISLYAPRQDSHRLAVFLSQSGVMARSGYFCAHHYLKEQLGLPPLLRFSLGLHSTPADIDKAVQALARLMKGLS
ncbi:aminotransferase class V-fold PLP-dependent enzyme [Cryobacterium sp. TMT1-21]|uniref:Aminotransferase class V-fold PLP-dependent enzyme n=1 Tax=Cryobacterium shii TaxID=1259235 RepID=A0AAQ2C6P9_9MICO|nr:MULTISPECIES: aminotransferase class V-fold PLP-dependent enzyme [Cryobacterium]TFC48875.1 aminotransferase class V-fold PLP-dependent enzyme [Cryobacterium shii]TFC82968.1 aminotransferase class V-fold PLP-dependent enzyme [Cryobacterium sp. TmT2-59]TFD12563.1 aminotransferase class V-fold PLP-dependent enzyme [Cryobacterium sp. TMT1-21]TFD17254.1 aminotransferase class V-fold PLP-dependent enzyme [Cryobacterium sp. TMT4-10]TFD25727.1 aminotransferase class V-fold PLP-dependent enzyme [Cry